MSPLTTLALIRWAELVAGLLCTGFSAGYCARGEWQVGLWLLVLGVALLSLPLKRRRQLASAHAAQQWSPARVREALAAAGAAEDSRVEQVRVLRRLDAQLGLADAVRVVERAGQADTAER